VRIGLACNVKPAELPGHLPEDAFEEFDSPDAVAQIRDAIASFGHDVTVLAAGPGLVDALREARPDFVFNLAEGTGGRCREAHVPALLELLGIPYAGSDPLTLCVTLDKPVAKRLAASGGFPTPAFAVCRDAEDDSEALPPLPVIVKPAFEGSSKGVRLASRATTDAAVREMVRFVTEGYGQEAIVEAFVAGPEVTVGIVGNGRGARVLGMMEIVPKTMPNETFVYSLEVKRDWKNQVAYRVPPALPAAVLDALSRCALGIYRLLGCRDFARLDFRVDREGVPQFIECNPLPGLCPGYGDLPIMAEAVGISHRALVGEILGCALARHGMVPA
jgi:D-alanine-D-alanine ligase